VGYFMELSVLGYGKVIGELERFWKEAIVA
jgi:hypothetical protein